MKVTKEDLVKNFATKSGLSEDAVINILNDYCTAFNVRPFFTQETNEVSTSVFPSFKYLVLDGNSGRFFRCATERDVRDVVFDIASRLSTNLEFVLDGCVTIYHQISNGSLALVSDSFCDELLIE